MIDIERYARIAKYLVDAALKNHDIQRQMRDLSHTLGPRSVDDIRRNPPVVCVPATVQEQQYRQHVPFSNCHQLEELHP